MAKQGLVFRTVSPTNSVNNIRDLPFFTAPSVVHFFFIRQCILAMPRVYDPARVRPRRQTEKKQRRRRHGIRVYVFEAPSRRLTFGKVGRPAAQKRQVIVLQIPRDSRRGASSINEDMIYI